MTHPILKTAKEACEILRKNGHVVNLSWHPTSFGNSAYITSIRGRDGITITKRMRLSDHDTGDFRAMFDDCFTVIYDDLYTTADKIADMVSITNESLDKTIADYKNQKVEAAAKQAKSLEAEIVNKKRIQAENDFNERMLVARKKYIAENHPEFDDLTKTKQKPIIKEFNRAYRKKHMMKK